MSVSLTVQELWLQHNLVTDLAQVQALQPVTALQQLWLQPCPLHASLGEQYRPAVVNALPSLEVRHWCICGRAGSNNVRNGIGVDKLLPDCLVGQRMHLF